MDIEPTSEEEKKYTHTSQEKGVLFMRTSSFSSHLSSLGVNADVEAGVSSFRQSVASLLFSIILSSLLSIWKVRGNGREKELICFHLHWTFSCQFHLKFLFRSHLRG